VVANLGNQLGVNAVIKPDGTQSKKSSAASAAIRGSGLAVAGGLLTMLLAFVAV
jgi:hypothetical protein